MTHKEKARELINKYTSVNGNSFFAKECAIVAVDEIIYQIDCIDTYLGNLSEQIAFWQSVKTELETLK